MKPRVEFGVPGFIARDIRFAIHYGDMESVEAMIKSHRIWCIQNNREDLMPLFDTCEVLATHT